MTRKRSQFDEDPLLDHLGIVPRDQRDSSAQTPAVPLLESPGQEPTTSAASGRPEAPSNQAASSIGSKAVQELATGANGKAAGPATQETAQEEYSRLSRQRGSQDKNGRLKSAVWNAFLQMSEQANRALASGRPIDEYALAGVAGRGIGGAARGAFDPSVDEEYKRRMRMGNLEQQIGQQIKIEQEQAQTEKLKADATYIRDIKPRQEEAKNRRLGKPKRQVSAGQVIDYKPKVDANGEQVFDQNGDPQWEAYNETVDGKPLLDKSKMPDDDGILPSQNLRAKLTREEIEGRKSLAQSNNKFKAGENAKDRSIKRSELSEKIAARLEKDKQARVRAGQAVSRITISLAKAKIEAKKADVNIDDYIDALSDNGVEVIDK